MPQAKLTQTYVQSLQPSQKRQIFRDLLIFGLVLFVEPSGKKTWYIDYKRPNGKRTYHKVGSAEILTVAQARDIGKEFLASVTLGNDPIKAEEIKKERLTLKRLLFDFYSTWVLDNRRSGQATIDMVAHAFSDFMDLPIEEITILKIEQWRSVQRKQKSVKGASLNRYTTALKTVFNWAVKREILESNPIDKLDLLSERDSERKVRYLTDEERERFLAALDAREDRIRQERQNHNRWLKERNLPSMPDLENVHFADYFKPMLLVCLNTGARRNAVFSLLWRDVDLEGRMLTLRAEAAKSTNAGDQYIPMNDTLYSTLSLWKSQCANTAPDDFVFASPKTNGKFDNCRSAWDGLLREAGIQNFRWHDMRHDFASQLVMQGIDLNTVRDLLGHADLKMTLRYAHLAPENKLQAIKALDKKNGEKTVSRYLEGV
ncbi:recombinase [Synergistales bacterium]|nr:recombinase [Synergistales bacterium]